MVRTAGSLWTDPLYGMGLYEDLERSQAMGKGGEARSQQILYSVYCCVRLQCRKCSTPFPFVVDQSHGQERPGIKRLVPCPTI